MHLLDNNDTNNDNNEVPIIKHCAYYGENIFSTMLAYKAGLSILSGNIQSINAKFDVFQFCYKSKHFSPYQCYMSTGVLVR